MILTTDVLITDMPEKQEDFDRAVTVALKAVAINPSLHTPVTADFHVIPIRWQVR